MKKFSLIGLFLFAGFAAMAQVASISGTVKDEKGQPIPLAFVRDAQHYYATYADSSGVFTLKADPASVLTAVAVNYSDATVKIDKSSHIDIVMAKGTAVAVGSLGTASQSISAGGSVGFLNSLQSLTQPGSQTIKAGFVQEATKGSPYLFANWAHGFAVSKGDSLLYGIGNLYNFDKTTGNLLFTTDNNTVMQVNPAQIKYFSLFDGKQYPHVFENAPQISKMPFVELLLSTSKYKIYKKIETRLVRADFHSDGVIETGHRYDEYVDAVKYYFVAQGAKPQTMSLKKSTLKKLLAGDGDKFMTAQGDRDVDEEYVRELSYSLNQ